MPATPRHGLCTSRPFCARHPCLRTDTMFRSTFLHSFFRFRRARDGKARPPALRLEALETRANPVSAILDGAGTLFIDGSGGVGTPVNDRILVRQSGGF